MVALAPCAFSLTESDYSRKKTMGTCCPQSSLDKSSSAGSPMCQVLPAAKPPSLQKCPNWSLSASRALGQPLSSVYLLRRVEKLPCRGLTSRLLLHVDTIAGLMCYWPRKLPQGARVQRYRKEKRLQFWTSYSVMLLLSENGVKVYCNWSVLDLGNPLFSLLVFWSVIQELWAS